MTCSPSRSASRELQVDFRTGVLCVPIVFFDSVTGVVLARMQASHTMAYPRILAETNALLTHVREVSMAGHAPAHAVRSASWNAPLHEKKAPMKKNFGELYLATGSGVARGGARQRRESDTPAPARPQLRRVRLHGR